MMSTRHLSSFYSKQHLLDRMNIVNISKAKFSHLESLFCLRSRTCIFFQISFSFKQPQRTKWQQDKLSVIMGGQLASQTRAITRLLNLPLKWSMFRQLCSKRQCYVFYIHIFQIGPLKVRYHLTIANTIHSNCFVKKKY